MHIAKLNLNGNPNVGLYGIATDKFCLLSKDSPKKTIDKIKAVLKVPVFQISLYGTELIGLFAIANSKAVLIPNIVKPSEIKELRAKLKPLGITVDTIKTEYTALGNNILLNDQVGIISSVYPKVSTDKISKLFGVKLKQMNLPIPGSIGVATNKGGIFGMNISDEDIAKIEKLFGFEIGLGTVNMGNPLIRSGIIANSNGFVIGSISSGYEVIRVDESLGFLS